MELLRIFNLFESLKKSLILKKVGTEVAVLIGKFLFHDEFIPDVDQKD